MFTVSFIQTTKEIRGINPAILSTEYINPDDLQNRINPNRGYSNTPSKSLGYIYTTIIFIFNLNLILKFLIFLNLSYLSILTYLILLT